MSKRNRPTSWIPEDESPSAQAEGRNGNGSPARERKTYYLKADTIRGVEELAQGHGLVVSRLADFLLSRGLQMVEAGDLELPIQKTVVHELMD